MISGQFRESVSMILGDIHWGCTRPDRYPTLPVGRVPKSPSLSRRRDMRWMRHSAAVRIGSPSTADHQFAKVVRDGWLAKRLKAITDFKRWLYKSSSRESPHL